MAFATRVNGITQQFSTGATTHTVDLSSLSLTSGDLLLSIFSHYDSRETISTPPSGWTEIVAEFNTASSGNTPNCAIYGKVSNGSETSLAYGLSASKTACAVTLQYRDWDGTLANINAATGTLGVSSSPDPGSSGTVTSADNTFIAVVTGADDDASMSAVPTNYGNGTSVVSGGGTNNGCEIATADRQLAATSDDPGSFTMSTNEAWCWVMLVVPPDAGGGASAITGSSPEVFANAGTMLGTGILDGVIDI